MGYQETERYWSNFNKAEVDFNRRLETYKRHPELATIEECYNYYYNAEPITITSDEDDYQIFNKVKSAKIAIWYRNHYIK